MSEDGVDLYLCLDSIDMGFFFWETNITNRWASRFPRVVFLACVLSRKRSSFFFFLGGDVLKLLLKLRDFFGGTNTSTKISMEYHES